MDHEKTPVSGNAGRKYWSIPLLIGALLLWSPSGLAVHPPEESAFVFPEVSATEYQTTNVDCSGEFAIHSETKTEKSNWFLFVWWKSTTKSTHHSSIDYKYGCSATFSTTVEGWGGIDRRVGIRVPAGESYSTVLGDVGTDDIVGLTGEQWEEELDDGCSYVANRCSFRYSVPLSGGGSEVGVSEIPDEVCTSRPDVVAFNRANVAGGGLGPAGSVFQDDGLVDVESVVGADDDDDLCVTISWDEVDELGLQMGGGHHQRPL